MSLQEKVAFLKGLSEGLALDSESKEGKLFLAIIDTLSTMAEEIEELSENALDIGEELDAISDDLADVEEFLFDDDYNDLDFNPFDDDDEDFEDEQCGCAYCSGDNGAYQIECPNCNAEIDINEPDLLNGTVICSACGEELEFEFDDDEDEDDVEDEGL